MAHPFPLASVFTEGMRRDIDRAMMPGGSVWNLLDFIPDELGVAASGRGGWAYAGAVLTAATKIQSLSYAPFAAGAKLLAIDDNSVLWNVLTATSITGTVSVPYGPPVFYRDKLIIQGATGTTSALYYDGANVGQFTAEVAATTLLSVSGTIADGDTVTINNVTYRIKTTMALANDVQLGASTSATLVNIVRAVSGTGTGSNYYAGTARPRMLLFHSTGQPPLRSR